MTDIQDIASGVSNNSSDGDTFRNTFTAIGRANEGAAASVAGAVSAVAILKGILAGLGIAAGTGHAANNGNPNILDDGLAAFGTPEDEAATSVSGAVSAVAIAKGILVRSGFV